MAYGTLLTDTIKSSTSGPVAFQNTSGTEIGTLCRAWVNYKGTSTQSVRASFNVSSVTYNGTGDYTVNFTNALTDANYSVVTTWGNGSTRDWNGFSSLGAPTTTTLRLFQSTNAGAAVDVAYLDVAIFR